MEGEEQRGLEPVLVRVRARARARARGRVRLSEKSSAVLNPS